LEQAQVFRRRRVRRPADEGREGPNLAHIVVARFSLKPRTVMSSIMRARSGLTGRGEPSEVMGALAVHELKKIVQDARPEGRAAAPPVV